MVLEQGTGRVDPEEVQIRMKTHAGGQLELLMKIAFAIAFFVCGDSGETFRSLTDEEVTRYMARFAEPEDISPEEVEADMGFMIYPM